MQYKVKLTVIDKKLYPELQLQYCADPDSGVCPCYQVGDEFIFERYDSADSFWNLGLNSLTKTNGNRDEIAGGSKMPHCSEAWDAISRYIYTGLQGGSIMRGWMNDERVMITCCSDGTRPVIFKIERLDYKVLYIDGIDCDNCRHKIENALLSLGEVKQVSFRDKYVEVYLDKDISDEKIKQTVSECGEYTITKIE